MQAEAAHTDNYVRFMAWVQTHQKRLILLGAIVAVVIAAAIFFVYYQGQKEIRASQALSNVRVPVSPASPVPPGTAQAYLKVAREHRGTKAGARALLLGAATLFTDRDYPQAQKTFEDFLKQYPESQWVPQAHFGIASSLDAQGKHVEATAKFDEIRRRFGSEPIIDEVKLALGRLYENQGKHADAHKLYAELVQANPYSGIGSEAGVRKEDLEAKFPELAPAPPTNAPMLTPPPLTMLTNTALTNRPAQTNRAITLTNPQPRATTNTALPKPATDNTAGSKPTPGAANAAPPQNNPNQP